MNMLLSGKCLYLQRARNTGAGGAGTGGAAATGNINGGSSTGSVGGAGTGGDGVKNGRHLLTDTTDVRQVIATGISYLMSTDRAALSWCILHE